MKLLIGLSVIVFLTIPVMAQEEDNCRNYATKKECSQKGKSECIWLKSKEICKSKILHEKEIKEAGEKNLKRPKKGADRED